MQEWILISIHIPSKLALFSIYSGYLYIQPTCRQSVPSQQHFQTVILEPEDLNLFVVSTHLPDIFLSYYKAFGFTDWGKEETENFNNRFRKREKYDPILLFPQDNSILQFD